MTKTRRPVNEWKKVDKKEKNQIVLLGMMVENGGCPLVVVVVVEFLAVSLHGS